MPRIHRAPLYLTKGLASRRRPKSLLLAGVLPWLPRVPADPFRRRHAVDEVHRRQEGILRRLVPEVCNTAALEHIDDVSEKEGLTLVCRRLLERLGERVTRQPLGEPDRGRESTELAFLVGLCHRRKNLAAQFDCQLKHDENIE